MIYSPPALRALLDQVNGKTTRRTVVTDDTTLMYRASTFDYKAYALTQR